MCPTPDLQQIVDLMPSLDILPTPTFHFWRGIPKHHYARFLLLSLAGLCAPSAGNAYAPALTDLLCSGLRSLGCELGELRRLRLTVAPLLAPIPDDNA